jgi:hypothetical protein
MLTTLAILFNVLAGLPLVLFLLWLILKLRRVTPSVSFIEIVLAVYSIAAIVLCFLALAGCEGATGSRQLNVYSKLAMSVFSVRAIVALWLTFLFPFAVYVLIRACNALMDRRWLAGIDLAFVFAGYGAAIATSRFWAPTF